MLHADRLHFEFELPEDWKSEPSRREDWSRVDAAVLSWTALEIDRIRLVAPAQADISAILLSGPILTIAHEIWEIAHAIKRGERRVFETPETAIHMFFVRENSPTGDRITLWASGQSPVISASINELKRAATVFKRDIADQVAAIWPSIKHNPAFVHTFDQCDWVAYSRRGNGSTAG